MTELNQLQGKLANHVYDERDLDDVIGTLSRVVGDNEWHRRIATSWTMT